MYGLKTEASFDSAHFLTDYYGKCENLHGHNYVAMFEAEAPLDSLGRVIDFSVLKEIIGGWIDSQWDHGFLLWEDDADAIAAVGSMPGQKMYQMPYNPTAENMARYLMERVCPGILHGTGVQVVSVRIWETENCYADAST